MLEKIQTLNFREKFDSINPKDFRIKDVRIANDDCLLIFPANNFSVEWNNDNKYFRSAILRKDDFYPISLGFRKFMNLGENPDFEPFVENENSKFKYYRKIDGTQIIISKYKGEIIIRTRHRADTQEIYDQLAREETNDFVKQYPYLFDNYLINTEDFSFLCEWTTPNNLLCIKESEKSALWLIGIVRHKDYSYFCQKHLDILAKNLGLERPESYSFFDSQEEATKIIYEDLGNIEGVVAISPDGQILKKIKTAKFLETFAFRNNLNVDHIIDLYYEKGLKSIDNMQKYIKESFDFECLSVAQQYIEEFFEAKNKYDKWIADIAQFVEKERHLNQKDFARLIGETYLKGDLRTPIAFCLYNSTKINVRYEIKVLKNLFLVDKGKKI